MKNKEKINMLEFKYDTQLLIEDMDRQSRGLQG